jgi:hypothetical protein
MKALNSQLTQGPHCQNSPVQGPLPYRKDSKKALWTDYEHCHLEDVANILMTFSYCINHFVESVNLICKCLTAIDGTAGASIIKNVGLGASKRWSWEGIPSPEQAST